MAGEPGSGERQNNQFDLDRLREHVLRNVEKHHYETALFWADKLVTLSEAFSSSQDAVEDMFWYAQTLYHTGQYHRAATVLRNKKLVEQHDPCRYLAAKCLYECKEYQEALNILGTVEFSMTRPSLLQSSTSNEEESRVFRKVKRVDSSISLLRGRIYEAMDNRGLAVECFRHALQQDVYCFEAFDLLVSHHMMSAQEEQGLLGSLPFVNQCPQEEVELLKFLYENHLKKYNKPGEHCIPSGLFAFKDNMDVVVNQAERLYYNCDFHECYKITKDVLTRRDPLNSRCLPLHIAVLVELKKPNELFYLGHKLVDYYPNKPVSWFAVGCYYLLTKNYEPARRYLSKSTTLDKTYGPAWLAYGHSFAADNEHDQAMAAYFTASQIMKGCHLPVLYIGLEYGLTSNAKLADRFFTLAQTIAPDDPFVLHEMGVIAFHNQEWVEAERLFKEALHRIQDASHQHLPDKWEPLLNNLGHVARKLK
ncbi:hypothetical protein ACOMHN_019096 [Nucella lapillus]